MLTTAEGSGEERCMANQRYARHIAIVHLLRSRQWVSSTSLANRIGVSQRTIYRDVEELIAAGIPIEAVAGREGGYRLSSESPVDPLILDADDALRLYVLGLNCSRLAASVRTPVTCSASSASASTSTHATGTGRTRARATSRRFATPC